MSLASPSSVSFRPAPGLVVQDCVMPLLWSQFRVIAFDMDSTLITIECIDEIADAAGRREAVAAITEAAMQGEITDFKDSLRRRVALLEGVPVGALAEVLAQRLQLSDGAETLLDDCHRRGLTSLLVSGGFTYFADAVQRRLGLHHTRSNLLEIVDGRLTGRVLPQAWGDICDGDEKRRTLLALCEQLGCPPSAAIAVGDGANDLPMMEVAGLSVAFHAKPAVRRQAQVSIETGGLDRLLEVMES